ncbi:hypothetical protein Salat_2918300 [Sesamum alatum]|uniref:Myb/SANT-like domain-containing protein n=1 Tax=Sesamum alatum TaxID=300844 RepID=A0AAE1XJQ9_9LAMI|nr:hypothetical protein Salat_2918300 [Sesamum alatum]
MALVFAQKAVNLGCDWDHGLDFYEPKLELLRQRYHAFEAILRNPTFTWNTETNTVHATKDEWDAIVRVRDDLDDPEGDHQEHVAEPNEAGEGGSSDDDDGIVFMGQVTETSLTVLWTWSQVKGKTSGCDGIGGKHIFC